MRPVTFSASSANSYLACHLQWWFTYVLVEPSAPSEPMTTGIAIHEAAEQYLRGDRPGVYADEPLRSLELVFHRDILPTYREPLLIEEPFRIEVNGIPYSGVIDSLDRQDVPWGYANILRDLKTTASRPSPGRYRFNMFGYYLGVTEGLEHDVDGMQLDYIVRTQKPYYWPEVVPIPDQDDIDAWAATLAEIANGVERGEFSPTGLGTRACKSCGYAAQCGPYQRYKEITDANG